MSELPRGMGHEPRSEMQIKFWAAIGLQGRVYELQWTTTGVPPTKKLYMVNDEYIWRELVLK